MGVCTLSQELLKNGAATTTTGHHGGTRRWRPGLQEAARNSGQPLTSPAAVRRPLNSRRKDGHDGWHGRPREKNRSRILSLIRKKQAAVQWSSRPTPVWSQAVAGLLWKNLRYIHKVMEVSTATQVRSECFFFFFYSINHL